MAKFKLPWSQNSKSLDFEQLQEIKFFIQDEEHTVKINEITTETSLNEYLRKKAHLMATKNMCFEGGCGTCIVAASVMDPVTNRETVFAVNSCLIPIYSCSGWKIHTAEAIGNSKQGYHPVQKALVQFSGTQCGYCSSGMIMNMYAMYETGNFTMKDVDNSFGGNLCRCTGYRPILSAYKSLAIDATEDIIGKYPEIEDIPVCAKKGEKCQSRCATPCHKAKPFYFDLGVSRWVKVFSINEILDVMRQNPTGTYMLVGGNTATGVYRRTKDPDVFIDITSVKNLLNHTVTEEGLIIGANMSLTNAMALFYKLSKENPKYSYLEKLGDHIDLIANVPVRNTGTLAGNIYTKHAYNVFPSDIYCMFEAAGATIQILGTNQQEVSLNLVEFLSYNMSGKIIKSFTLPPLDSTTYKYESYKIMPRAQNAHALVNAGFLIKLDPSNKVESARLVFGSINESFTHASNAEKYLIGKQLFDNDTLLGLFQELEKEINPDNELPDPDPAFRRKLAIALCYKYILSITPPDKLSPRHKSGGPKQMRPVSKGTQDYESKESLYPLTKAIPKLEALAQCNGTAEYVNDIPDRPGLLYAAYVLAKAPPRSVISNINKDAALKTPGVVAYFDKNDIPGKNTYMPKEWNFKVEEELFCSGTVKYYYQTIGIVVATSQKVAEDAAKLVDVTFIKSKDKPLITVRDILASNNKEKIQLDHKVEAKNKGNDVKHVIKGEFDIFPQYHYYMELPCAVVYPTEDGLDVYPTTQNMDLTQTAISQVLAIPQNKVNVTVRRLGGGYGGKVSRTGIIICSAALAAYKLKKPVKFVSPLIENMNVMGKRYGCSANYEVGVDDKGVIQYMNTDIYSDYGYAGVNEYINEELVNTFTGTYESSTWNVTSYNAFTDQPNGSWCRAPATTEGLALIENIMDRIASDLKLDPLEVRNNNLDKTQPQMMKFIEDMKTWADVDKRKKDVEVFNKENRWVKRGISVVPMDFPLFYFGNWGVLISVYQGDGSVAVAHAGVEMGQGINTKVAQVCAYELGIPLEQVSIKPSNTLTTPNAFPTAGSITSEAVAFATVQACKILKDRMEPVKKKMNNPTWNELVKQSYFENIELTATSMFHSKIPEVMPYRIFGVTCAEVEVDLLTGLHQIRRLDVIEDTGDSMSPLVDIGQIEGALVMGIGYWTSEQLVYGPEGDLLTNRTWNYKPPGAKDIPVEFNVKFPKNNSNPNGVLHSKATAEPPQNMACAVPLAIRQAVNSARAEADPNAAEWIKFDGPTTVEQTFQQTLHDYKQYKL